MEFTYENTYDIYSKFDLQKHKQTYINYLEVIVLSDGSVEYAVPSHQEKLISILSHKWKCSRAEALAKCPQSMYGDFETWLLSNTDCIAVWSCGYRGEPNEAQRETLAQFVANDIMNNRII